MRTLLRALALVAFMLAPGASGATDLWAVTGGDPCCGIPADQFKYLDADEACVKEVPMPPAGVCEVNPRNMRNSGGPQLQGRCAYDVTCTCNTCGILPDFPNGGNTMTHHLGYTWKTAQNCPPGTIAHLEGCYFQSPRSKGPCPDCELVKANPVNIGSANKYQTETIYRAGALELVLTYNSQLASTYFSSGPFGKRWTAGYFVRLRDSGQGIVGVERPDGHELEFRAPTSGNVYVSNPDVPDRMETIIDSAGVFHEWRVTSGTTDERWAHSFRGRLLRIRDRALLDRTMIYSTASTPPGIAPEPLMLIAVNDPFGRQLNFTYDSKKRVVTMTDPAGGAYAFEYDGPSGPPGANNLTKLTFPDGRTRVYFYNEAAHINGGAVCTSPSAVLPNALTGLQDENGARYATWTYDCSGRVTGSRRALDTDVYTIAYAPGVRNVVDPLATSRSVTLQNILGVAHSTGTTQPAASGAGNAATAATYDANGNVASRTDFNGNRTNYGYDLTRNLETSRTEGLTASGAATPQTRTIRTEWDANFRLPARIAAPLKITTNVYDPDGTQCGARGALCSKTIQATNDANGSQGFGATPAGTPRTWTYTYNANGSVLRANGPRTDVADVTTYTYYANDDPDLGKRGNVATIANAAGHVTSITAYNAHGQPTAITDPNGLTTTLAYDARQRLTSRNVVGEVTSYEYDGVGQLTKVTLPDASFLSYTYDAAHRLTGMADNAGNRIAYTLDAMGNRTREEVFDPANLLAQTRSRVYSNLNRLFREVGAAGQTTEYGYDNQGNVVSVKDPLLRITANAYDALNRLARITDPALGVTAYGYDGLDALTQVTDPRNLITGYTVDGLGNLTQQVSPDTGTTASTYDAAGNLLTQTDAKGQSTAYAYDALGRVTLITFADGSRQAYAYDQGANGLGRLSSITEIDPANAVTSEILYAYDQKGRVASEARTVAGQSYVTGYAYDAAGRLTGMTYPSGRSLAYAFDALGRVNQVTTTKDAQTQVVVQNVQYHPFGGVKGFTLGNGQIYGRTIDQDGRIAAYTLGNASHPIAFDAASRITGIGANLYGYDALDRLTSAVLPSSNFGYSYDAVGNRLTKTTGAATDTYTYAATSNRLASITPASGSARSFLFDANGSTTNDGLNAYAYDTRGRMVQATSSVGSTAYQVNALGQRVRKANSQGETVFHYDTRGRLIAETDPGGIVKREYLYLGDIPVGVLQ